MKDLDMRPKVVKGIVGGQCPSCMRVDFHIEGCPVIPRDREIIHRNQEVRIKVEETHSLLGQLSTLRAENERMRNALKLLVNDDNYLDPNFDPCETARTALAPRGQEGPRGHTIEGGII